MALVRVVTRCQIYCSCGRTTTKVASHEAALNLAVRELSGCRRAAPTYPILHQISEDLWLNVGVRLPIRRRPALRSDPFLAAARDAPTPRMACIGAGPKTGEGGVELWPAKMGRSGG